MLSKGPRLPQPKGNDVPLAVLTHSTVTLLLLYSAVYRWVEAKELPAHRVERLRRFQISEVNQYVRANGENSSQIYERIAPYKNT